MQPRPRPFAPVLAFLLDGAGHFALGHWLRGLVFNLADSVLLTAGVIGARALVPRMFWAALALTLVIRIVAVIDVARLRRTAGPVPSAGKVVLACAA